MRIAVLGAGAMGALFGGYLSRENEVTMVDISRSLVEKISRDGVVICEPDRSAGCYYPAAVSSTSGMAPVDLIIVFVKAMFTRSALEKNKNLIGPGTYLMTLQNGSGHEEILLEFADGQHVIIGTTQHNSAVAEPGIICHGGNGPTHIGCLNGEASELNMIADAFTRCGLETDYCDNVARLIWKKMFTNVSASVLTAVLQVPLGYIAANESAWAMCETLVQEAVAVANGDGMNFDAEEEVEEVRHVCENSPDGITSIAADLKNGRRSEVDSISGSVVKASRRNGVPAPGHEFIVHMVHAIEGKSDT